MTRWRRGGRHALPMNAEISLTNLVDVAFVLLIIFMITAPILAGGVEVQLPRAEAAPLTTPEGVIVSVTKEGRIFIGNVPVADKAEFANLFPKYMRDKGAKEAFIKGDRDVPYGRVMEVIGLMNKADVGSVGLVAEPERSR